MKEIKSKSENIAKIVEKLPPNCIDNLSEISTHMIFAEGENEEKINGVLRQLYAES